MIMVSIMSSEVSILSPSADDEAKGLNVENKHPFKAKLRNLLSHRES